MHFLLQPDSHRWFIRLDRVTYFLALVIRYVNKLEGRFRGFPVFFHIPTISFPGVLQ